jgi:hypothetical protein
MSYTIKYTNGKTLSVIADQSIDDVSTSLTLVGKNVNNYGQFVNGNFVALLENFANLLEPSSPVVGQTWFDTSEGRLKVYSTGTFKPVGSPIISTVEPAGAVRGDLWVDTTNNLLKWYDGLEWQLSAKQYSDSAGKEGWFVDTISDNSGFDHDVSIFYSQGSRWAVMSTSTIGLISGSLLEADLNTSTIRPGLTINSAIGAKFYGTATSADSVAGLNTSSFLLKDRLQESAGTINFTTNTGIRVGTNTNIELYVDTSSATSVSVIAGTIEAEPFEIRYNSENLGPNATAFHIDTENDRVGIFNSNPTTDLDITGDVRINGSLIVEGSQVSLETTFLRVEDKNIELATGQTTGSNTFATGGGITLRGTTDKTWTYESASESWQSNININLATTSGAYMIAGSNVFEYDGPGFYRLSNSVRSAPGLSALSLDVLTVSNVIIYDQNITTSNSPLVDLYLTPSTGFVNLNNTTKISGMAQTLDTDPDDYAVTKGYFDGRFASALGGFAGRKPYTLNLDITDFTAVNDEIIATLNLTLPVDGFGDPYYVQPDGARCTVLCTRYEATTATYLLSNLNTATVRQLFNFVTDISYTATSTTTSFINTVSSTSSLLVTDFEIAGSVTIATPMPRIVRSVKLFAVIAGYWTFIEDVDTVYLTSPTPSTLSTGSKTFVVNRDSSTVYSSLTTWGDVFNTGTIVTIRETDTQVNFLDGVVTAYSGTNLVVNVTNAFNTATTSTFSSWIIRRTV